MKFRIIGTIIVLALLALMVMVFAPENQPAKPRHSTSDDEFKF